MIIRNPYNIIVAGVGGQGNLVCGKALAEAAICKGLSPVLGDTFGASRRGGSVLSHLRIADKDLGPLVPRGQADLLLGMEPIECLRAARKFASNDTIAVLSTMPLHSPSTRSGEYRYPETSDIIVALENICSSVYSLNPEPIIEKIGSYRILNVLMLGFLTGLQVTPLGRNDIETGVDRVVGLDERNSKAFLSGYNEGEAKRVS